MNRGQPATRCARDLRLVAQGLLQRRPRTYLAGAGAFGNEAACSVLQNATGFPAGIVAWADAIRSADGLIIVSPEYNWSIPGGLKNAIDWVSRMKDQSFKDKPVALQSAAGGILGGSRMQYHLRQSLTSVDALLFGRPEVIVTFAAQKFDEKTLELKDQTAGDMIKLQLGGFETFIRRVSAKD